MGRSKRRLWMGATLTLLCIGLLGMVVGGVTGETGQTVSTEGLTESDPGVDVQSSDSAGVTDARTTNSTGGQREQTAGTDATPGPLDEPGEHVVDVSELSVVTVEIAGPGGGGGGGFDGVAGGDGGYLRATLNVSAFDELEITVGSGGGGGIFGNAGGSGFSDGGSGGSADNIYDTDGGGGGGSTVIEGIEDGTPELLAAVGGGGGGVGLGFDAAGGGGGAPGGSGGDVDDANGNDAEPAVGPIPSDIGGDGGNATSSPGDDGGTWVNPEYAQSIEDAVPGGGGNGGVNGADGADGSVNVLPKLVIESIEFPDTIGIDEKLTVEYTLTNTRGTAATESSVNLKVNGTVRDSDENVTVEPDELVNGTLTFDGVGELFSPGKSIPFNVTLSDYGDEESGATDIFGSAAPTVYVGSDDGTLYAVDAATGEQEWAFIQPSLGVQSSPTVADGTVYVGSSDLAIGGGDGTLYAVDAATGEQEWAFTQPSGDVDSSPTVVDGTVYVGSGDSESDDGTLYAVDAATGSQKWAFTQPSNEVRSSPTVVDGTVYVGSKDDTLYAVDAATGSQEWAFTQPSAPVRSSPTVADGTVYVGSKDDTLYAVDADSGEQEWAFTQPSEGVDSSPTVVDGTVYVGSKDDTLYAVDADSGEQEWAFTQPSEGVDSSPTVVDGTVYVGSFETLYAVDAATGGQEWNFTQPSSFVYSSPTVVSGTVYVGSDDATLYAVDAATGSQEWAFTQPSNEVRSSPTVVSSPQNGDSIGSRVTRGTLGHHQVWPATQNPEINMTVDLAEAPNPVEGESLSVTATLWNTGDETVTQTVGLDVPGLGNTTTEVTIPDGNSTQRTVTVDTGDGDAGNYTATLSSENDSDSVPVEVLAPATFSVEILDVSAPVEGETLAVTADVENTGDLGGRRTIELTTTPSLGQDTTELTLDPGASTQETLTVSTDEGDAGAYSVIVATASDSVSRTVTVLEQAFFEVTVTGTNSPVIEGETLSVTTTIENTGGTLGEQTVSLDAGGLGDDSALVQLNVGESTTETFTVGTGSGDAGGYTVTVSSDDDSDSTSVTVEEPPEPNFQVNVTGTTVPVEGETLSVTADIENTGDALGEQTVSLDIESLGTDSASVQLADGELTTETFSVETNVGDAGTYTATVSSNDDSSSVPVNVETAYPDFVVGITGTNAPVAEGETLSVTAGIENQGSVSGEQTVSLDAGSLGDDSALVQLNVGESTTETFTVGTGSGDAGDYTVTVSSNDDSNSVSVLVEEAYPDFVVGITGTNAPVAEGETLSVTADIENTGGVNDTQTITLDAGSVGTDSTSVTLDGGESTEETLSVSTAAGDAGEYTASVASEDDSANTSITVQEPARFVVSIDSTNSPVVGSETLTVDVTVSNTGDVSDSQTIALDVGALGTDSTNVSLLGGSSADETLSVATEADDDGNYTATVVSEDDNDSASVEVLEPEPATLQLQSIDAPAEIAPDEQLLNVTYTIENTGDLVGTESVVRLRVAGAIQETDEDVTVGPDDTATGTLVFDGVADDYSGGESITATVELLDYGDNLTATTEVLEPANFSVESLNTANPVEGDPLTVTASIENTGEVAGTQTVELTTTPSTGENETDVLLGSGESADVTLSVPTGEGDAGEYLAKVTTANDSASTPVTVLEDAEFTVSIEGTNSPVSPGESLTVTTNVTNTGDVETTQTVELTTTPGFGQTETDVQLGSGESTVVTLSVPTGEATPGVYIAEVTTEDASASTSVTVELAVPSLPGFPPPRDPDGDGRYEDVNGKGGFSIFDVQAFFINLQTATVQDDPAPFNFDENEPADVTIFDVQALFTELSQGTV